jgi:hypothetical protein
MYNLIYMVVIAQAQLMGFMGEYNDLASCQYAIHEIYATRLNPAGQRNPELEKTIQLYMATKTEFVCIPVKKG